MQKTNTVDSLTEVVNVAETLGKKVPHSVNIDHDSSFLLVDLQAVTVNGDAVLLLQVF